MISFSSGDYAASLLLTFLSSGDDAAVGFGLFMMGVTNLTKSTSRLRRADAVSAGVPLVLSLLIGDCSRDSVLDIFVRSLDYILLKVCKGGPFGLS